MGSIMEEVEEDIGRGMGSMGIEGTSTVKGLSSEEAHAEVEERDRRRS